MPKEETYETFELRGLSWTPRRVSYAEWSRWAEMPSISAREAGLAAMFVEGPLEQLKEETPVREYETALAEVWLAVRMPPALGEA